MSTLTSRESTWCEKWQTLSWTRSETPISLAPAESGLAGRPLDSRPQKCNTRPINVLTIAPLGSGSWQSKPLLLHPSVDLSKPSAIIWMQSSSRQRTELVNIFEDSTVISKSDGIQLVPNRPLQCLNSKWSFLMMYSVIPFWRTSDCGSPICCVSET